MLSTETFLIIFLQYFNNQMCIPDVQDRMLSHFFDDSTLLNRMIYGRIMIDTKLDIVALSKRCAQ